MAAITHTVPLANLMDGQIAALRHWAKGRASEAASHATPGPHQGHTRATTGPQQGHNRATK